MMRPVVSFLLLSLFTAFPVLAQDKDKPPAFKWLSTSGEASGVRLETHKLQTISISQYGSAAEAETETVPLGSGGKKTTTRVYDTDANGKRALVETVVEEIRDLPGGRTEATKTVSRPDMNGRTSVVLKYTQEVIPSGANSFQIQFTIQSAGSQGGALVTTEKLIQNEVQKGPNESEIDRISMVPGPNAAWVTRERRISTNKKNGAQSNADEVVYSPDTNGKLQVKNRITSREWTDAPGKESREITTLVSDLSGRLILDNRIHLTREKTDADEQQTTQTVTGPNPAAPSSGNRVIEKITETIRPAGSGATERYVPVLNPDLNGNNQTTYTLRTTQIK